MVHFGSTCNKEKDILHQKISELEKKIKIEIEARQKIEEKNIELKRKVDAEMHLRQCAEDMKFCDQARIVELEKMVNNYKNDLEFTRETLTGKIESQRAAHEQELQEIKKRHDATTAQSFNAIKTLKDKLKGGSNEVGHRKQNHS